MKSCNSLRLCAASIITSKRMTYPQTCSLEGTVRQTITINLRHSPMRSKICLLLLVVQCSTVVVAAPIQETWFLPATTDAQIGIRPSFTKCLASDQGSSVAARKVCIRTEDQYQNLRLAKAYKAAFASLPVGQRNWFQDSQKAWLKMLPAHCKLEAGYPDDGADFEEMNARCQLHWRAYRAKYFEALQKVWTE